MIIRKNGGQATATVSLTGQSGTVSASGASNLLITPASRTVASGTPAAFVIKSTNNTRGDFTVTFTTPCGTKTVAVTVSN
jgi:uncharacterized cupredoxin-like copper-binding protein